MKNYTIYGTSDTKRFFQKNWTAVATVRAKSKAQAMREFRDSTYRENDMVKTTSPFAYEYASYRVKIDK
jgi:hypothetical protein